MASLVCDRHERLEQRSFRDGDVSGWRGLSTPNSRCARIFGAYLIGFGFDFGGTPKRRLKEKTTVDPVEQEPAEEESIIEEPSSAAPVPEPEHQPEENEANSIGDEMDVVDGETVPDEEAARVLHE